MPYFHAGFPLINLSAGVRKSIFSAPRFETQLFFFFAIFFQIFIMAQNIFGHSSYLTHFLQTFIMAQNIFAHLRYITHFLQTFIMAQNIFGHSSYLTNFLQTFIMAQNIFAQFCAKISNFYHGSNFFLRFLRNKIDF